MNNKLHELTIILSAENEAAITAFQSFAIQTWPQGWEELDRPFDKIAFRVHVLGENQTNEMIHKLKSFLPEAEIEFRQIIDEDWEASWKKFFTPIRAGDLFEVRPPWHERQAPEEIIELIIEPKMAFGTGHHPTTALCLEFIGNLYVEKKIQAGWNFLDLGTGSGILGIAMCRLGLQGLGIDIDPQAIACAKENALYNKADSIKFAVGGLECLNSLDDFKIIVANILAGPLIEMADELSLVVKKGGILILSGILQEQMEAVKRAYAAQGLQEPQVLLSEEWAALLWPAATPACFESS